MERMLQQYKRGREGLRETWITVGSRIAKLNRQNGRGTGYGSIGGHVGAICIIQAETITINMLAQLLNIT